MKKHNINYFKIVLLIVPFFFGVLGFAVIEHEPLSDAFFNSILMYFLNYGDTPPNFALEIARWTAPLATAGGIIIAFHRLSLSLKHKFQYLHGNTTAVYGNRAAKDTLLEELGNKGIDCEDELVPAHRYILIGDERENLDFYTHYHKELKDIPVFIKCSTLRAQTIADSNVRLFSSEELASRIFWKQQSLYERFLQNHETLDIVFVGFERLGEELLIWGLQNLLFSSNQKIHYHIFGYGDSFLALHPYLDQIEDTITFHRSNWNEKPEIIENSDMTIILQQDDQLSLLYNMLSLIHNKSFYVFADQPEYLSMMDESERLHIFDWKREALQLENIVDNVLLKRAQRINLRYAHIYSNVEETSENAEIEWEKLNTFTRYSNISAADYQEVRIEMLKHMGYTTSDTVIRDKDMELLAGLEHERWCRYHYLNNWHYGIPSNGKNKDFDLRIHTDLVPYSSLSEEDKVKDRENIHILLSIE